MGNMGNLGNAAMLISLLASLFLAVRAFRAGGVNFKDKAWMAVAWAAIITVLAMVINWMG